AEAMLLQRFSPTDAKKWKKIEKWLFNQADQIVGVSPEFRNYISPAFIKKYSTIPCSVNPAIFIPNTRCREEIRHQYQLTSRIIFVFSGSMGLWEQTHSLVQVFKNIQKEIPAAFLLIITQTQNEENHKIFEQIKSDSFLILHLPPEQVPMFLMAADIGLLIRQKHLINKVSLTVKFGEYLAAGLPVMVTASTGEAARLVMTYQCGTVIEDENDLKINEKILQLLNNYDKLKQNGAKLVTEYLNIQNCARKYLELYEQSVQSH
ncbi:glycosyltransferase, partial [candidate division KSB1 bacterium]|nr:glycosyltransferase [candidate division KSB1 bacterium]